MRIDLDRSSTVRSLAVAGVLIAATMLAPVVAGLGTTDTITVCQDGSCDYTEIQPAVDAAQPGDEIVVQNEDEAYEGPVHIDTPRITLSGNDPWFPIQIRAYGQSVLQIDANDVTVRGFHLVGADARIEQARNVALDFMITTLSDDGLTIRQSTATVTNSRIWSDGITPNGTAITVDGPASSGFVLKHTTVGMFGDGIKVVDADNVRIEDSAVSATEGPAIHLIGASNPVEGTRVIDNEITTKGGAGLLVEQAGTEVRDTVLRANDLDRVAVVGTDGAADWTADPVDARWNWWGEPVPSLENRGSVLVAPWCVHSSCVSAPAGH